MADAKTFHALEAETIEAIEAIRRMAARGTSDNGLEVAPDDEDDKGEDDDEDDDDEDGVDRSAPGYEPAH